MWPTAPACPLAGLFVLLADDAVPIRQLYADAFRRAGAEVVEAEDGAAALARWQEAESTERPFDAVVLDYVMPGLDGADVAARLRGAGYTGTIVGVSGEVGAAEEDRWLAAGCERVVCKGLSVADFVATVAAACGRWAG